MDSHSNANEFMYSRTLSKTIYAISDSFPVLMVTGPRQVGKTTLLEICAKVGTPAQQRAYVTLDDMDARALARSDPALFLQTWQPPLIIDEIQYAPQLFSAIKIMVDRDKRNGLFWLTGSQKFQLMRGITESLAGRVASMDLLGLSQAELDGRAALQDANFRLTRAMPALERAFNMWRASRIKTDRPTGVPAPTQDCISSDVLPCPVYP